jgi:Tfp pilus assembly protein PilO
VKILYRRKKQQYWFAAILGVIAAINLLFFLILYRPVRSEYYGLQQSIQQQRARVQSQRQEVARLERLSAQLESSEKDRQRLFTSHFIPRSAGFSEILPRLEEIAVKARVSKTRVDYNIEEVPHYGLYSVKIRIPVNGGYSSIVNFIKALEDSDTFFIIDSIEVAGASQSPGSDLSLSLALETFFYQ